MITRSTWLYLVLLITVWGGRAHGEMASFDQNLSGSWAAEVESVQLKDAWIFAGDGHTHETLSLRDEILIDYEGETVTDTSTHPHQMVFTVTRINKAMDGAQIKVGDTFGCVYEIAANLGSLKVNCIPNGMAEEFDQNTLLYLKDSATRY